MADNNNNKILNVPPLRFPEFTDEWEKCKVSDLLDFYSTNSLSWEQLEYTGSGMRNLHYGLIHVGLPTLVDVGNALLPNIKERFVPKNYQLCNNGDVAFADASEDTNEVAKVVELTEIKDEKVVCGLHTIHGRDNKGKTVIGYKGYAFSSDAFHKQIRRIAQGTKIFSISTKNFSECYIGIPSIKEQTKIAAILSLLDRRIAVQTKIIEKYKSLIKGLRHKLFASISGDVTMLSKVANIYQPQTISSKELTETGYSVYGANGIIGKYHSYNHENEQVCITCRGNTCGTVNYTLPKSWITGNAMVINSDDFSTIVDKRYLYNYLCSINFSQIISGSGQPQIVRSPLEKLQIVLPKITEQQKVAHCLDSFLYRIKIEETIAMRLEEQKQYLLRQMFI